MTYTSALAADLQFEQDPFPIVIVNDGSVTTLSEAVDWIESHLEDLKRELDCTGALLFRGFPITDTQDYDTFFSAFGYRKFTYRESLSNAVRINFTEKVFTANEGPRDVAIYIHNEMAQTPIYPNVISLFCQSAAEHAGETMLCRSDRIYEGLLALEPELTVKLERVGIKYTTRMPAADALDSGQGRSWCSTLNAETREQAEERLRELNYQWIWHEDGSLSAQSAALPAIKTLEDGRKVFFNQIIAAYMGWKGVKEDPSVALCFGDNSAIPSSFLDSAVTVAEGLTYDLAWQDGDVAIVNNHLVKHGRRPFSGDRPRKVFVALGL
jgi:alpha-ketoglutarate-dependent taurine dioxygenase